MNLLDDIVQAVHRHGRKDVPYNAVLLYFTDPDRYDQAQAWAKSQGMVILLDRDSDPQACTFLPR